MPAGETLPVEGPIACDQRLTDGTVLAGDLWRPAAPGRYPVLLMRQPYGKRIASTVVYAHPAWYAAHGYMVLVQDVRGRGASSGAFSLFAGEEADGAEAVAFAAALPHCDGQVAMYGFSYQANTQLLALAGGAGLAALAPCMAGFDLHGDWAYEGGAFCLAANLGWAAQLGAESARRAGDAEAFRALQAAARSLPLGDGVTCRPAVLERYAGLTHYQDWLDHPARDGYWQAIAPRDRLAGRTAPLPAMLHVGGWYDAMLAGTLDGHAALGGTLTVGPWSHLPWGRRAGERDFGPGAGLSVDRLQLAFFDHHLKGRGPAPESRLFDAGLGAFVAFEGWAPQRPWFIASTGLAAATAEDGRLTPDPGGAGSDRFVHDPWRPVPAVGGHNAPLGGARERGAIDERADVAVYTSPPLDRPLTLCGPVAAEIAVETDAPDFDLSAVLSVVEADGRAFNVTQGYRRAAGAAPPLRVAMRALRLTLQPGQRLRLSLAGACFPAFPVNPGTAQDPTLARPIDQRSICYQVHHRGSMLLLPVLEG
ncbi:MAG: CocE/NonD family hydrolase [Thalassobaculales bacterium]